MEGYCFKCKKKTLMVQTTETRQVNGAVIVKGSCEVCRGKMSTLVKGGRPA